jgi:hypothetical protein
LRVLYCTSCQFYIDVFAFYIEFVIIYWYFENILYGKEAVLGSHKICSRLLPWESSWTTCETK